jgi:hypothetical protein
VSAPISPNSKKGRPPHKGANNEALFSLLDDLIRATKRKILALERLRELDDIQEKRPIALPGSS